MQSRATGIYHRGLLNAPSSGGISLSLQLFVIWVGWRMVGDCCHHGLAIDRLTAMLCAGCLPGHNRRARVCVCVWLRCP